jgi:MoaA/NifB/PqqE/SkfB family radical SAM enzyme
MDTDLKQCIADKSLIIWGARIVGIGLSRKCKKESVEIISFIDSDESLCSRKVNGIEVNHPSKLSGILENNAQKNIAIIVAVSIKEDEIRSALENYLPINHNAKIYYYKDFSNVYYTIDVVSSCNLACLSCAHSLEGPKPGGIMSIDSIKKVITKIQLESPNCSHVSLYSWGEPLIHPQIGEIIELFHDAGMAVGISTNLSHPNFKNVEKAVNSNPDYIKVSVSGYYPRAYNNTHQGGDITLVKSNLYKLAYVMRRKGIDSLVDINYHLYKDNSGQNLEKMQELAKELGFVISTVHALVMPLERVMNYKQGSPDAQTVELEKNLLVTIDEGIEASKSVELVGGCPFKHNQININADLTVPVCCLVFNRENLVSANFLHDELSTINLEKEKASICEKCMRMNLPQYNMGFNKESWEEAANKKIICDAGL